MAATLEDFTFGTLRDSLRTEFGGSTGLDTEIGRKLNDALALIWQEQKCWKWALKYVTLTSYPKIVGVMSVAAIVGQGDTDVTPLLLSNTSPASGRWALTIAGDSNEYLTSRIQTGSPNAVWLVGDGLQKAAPLNAVTTLKQAWLELPADFAYMHILRSSSGTTLGARPTPVEPWVLEQIRAGLLAPGPEYGGGGFYAIVQDPLPYDYATNPIRGSVSPTITTDPWQPNRQFIGFWPYPTSLTKWDGYYYTVPKGMAADADIYELPRGFRRRLFYKAAELMAAKLRDFEAVQYYAQQGLIGAEMMANANSFADDSDAPLRMQPFSYSQLVQGGVVTVP